VVKLTIDRTRYGRVTAGLPVLARTGVPFDEMTVMSVRGGLVRSNVFQFVLYLDVIDRLAGYAFVVAAINDNVMANALGFLKSWFRWLLNLKLLLCWLHGFHHLNKLRKAIFLP